MAYEALDEPDAWRALAGFLERSLHLQFGDRPEPIMNNPALGHPRVGEARTRIAPLLTRLVERAKKQGAWARTSISRTGTVRPEGTWDRRSAPRTALWWS